MPCMDVPTQANDALGRIEHAKSLIQDIFQHMYVRFSLFTLWDSANL